MKPILFNTEMVMAILDGRKTQTRRPPADDFKKIYMAACRHGKWNEGYGTEAPEKIEEWYFKEIAKPKYAVGDILYVRETVWQKCYPTLSVDGESGTILWREFKYIASDIEPKTGWNYGWCKRPSIHMPREAARIFLHVTDVKIQRLDDLTERDAINDGFEAQDLKYAKGKIRGKYETALLAFKDFWIAQYGTDTQWIWVYTFERCDKPTN